MPTTGTHEPRELLRSETLDLHRAIESLMEELEAVDWYQQRIDATEDEELKRILAHNRDEEKEHACMVIEWLRRKDATFAEHLRTFLFSDGGIVSERHDGAPASEREPAPSLGLGSLREAVPS